MLRTPSAPAPGYQRAQSGAPSTDDTASRTPPTHSSMPRGLLAPLACQVLFVLIHTTTAMPAVFVLPQPHDTPQELDLAQPMQDPQQDTPGPYDDPHDGLRVNLTVGIPPQHVAARISFSSADTVIFSGPSAGFDPGRSTSFVQGLRDGDVLVDDRPYTGNVSKDRIEVDGAVVREGAFIESAGPSEYGAYLGLGYKSFVGPDSASLVSRLSAKWEKPFYGLYLPPVSYHASIEDSWRRQSLTEGSVSFGKPDPRYARGAMQWLESDAHADGSWSVPFTGVSIDGKSVPLRGYPHAAPPNASSPRTTAIRAGPATRIAVSQRSRKYVLPDAMVDGLLQEVPGAVKWTYAAPGANRTVWEVPCDTRARVALRLGARDVRLRPADWTFRAAAAARARCFAEFAYLSEAPGPALGTRFLEAFYTLWNLHPPELGLMRLADGVPRPEAPGAASEGLGAPLDAAAAADALRLSGPVPPLRDALAARPSTRRCAPHSYALALLGALLAAALLVRLWRRGRLTPRAPLSPRYAPVGKLPL